MRNFKKKVKDLKRLFINKFSHYDYISQKIIVYCISPDFHNVYIKVDITPQNGLYRCEMGRFYLDSKNKKIFEDTPVNEFDIDKSDYKSFRNCYDNTTIWNHKKLKELIELEEQTNIDLVF